MDEQESDGLGLVRLFYPVVPALPTKNRRRYYERHNKGSSFSSGGSGGCKSSLEFAENGLSLRSGTGGAE